MEFTIGQKLVYRVNNEDIMQLIITDIIDNQLIVKQYTKLISVSWFTSDYIINTYNIYYGYGYCYIMISDFDLITPYYTQCNIKDYQSLCESYKTHNVI